MRNLVSSIREAISLEAESGLGRIRVVLRMYSASGFAIAVISIAYFLSTKLDIKFDRKDIIPLALAASGVLLFLLSRAASQITRAMELHRSVSIHVGGDPMRILNAWREFERASARRLGEDPDKHPISTRYLIGGLLDAGVIQPEEAGQLDGALSIRNSVAHSEPGAVNPARIQEALNTLRRITQRVNAA